MEQASLGSPVNISLGGYIPAAQKQKSTLEQALSAFLQGAAGGAGQHLVDAAFTPDMSDEMMQNETLQAAGNAPTEKRGAVAKFLAPVTAEQQDRALQLANQTLQRRESGKNSERDYTLAKAGQEQTKTYQDASLAEQKAGREANEKLAAANLFLAGQRDASNTANENERLALQKQLTEAQAASTKAGTEATITEQRRVNDMLWQQLSQEVTAGVQNPDEVKALQKSAAELAKSGKTVLSYESLAQAREAIKANVKKPNTGKQPTAKPVQPSMVQDVSGNRVSTLSPEERIMWANATQNFLQ